MPSTPRSVWPAGQGALAAELDGDAIGHRIGKGHAQFDDVGARLRQGLEDRLAGGEVRIAGHDEGDERRTVLRPCTSAKRLSIRVVMTTDSPRYLPTLSTSLSPRPDRHSTID